MPPAASAPQANFKVVLLAPADDPRLDRRSLERGFPGHPTGPAADALGVALQEGRIELDAAQVGLSLEVVEVGDATAARAAAARAQQAGVAALVADLPASWLLAAGDGARLPLLNLAAGDDALREADCRRLFFHLVPSDRMRADAVAQWLVSRRWRKVLLVVGPSEADRVRGLGVEAAIRRFGLELAGRKAFKLSADPRERDLANPLLLTQGSYDVVWVVDSVGEFAASLPYQTALPRPVVGDGGLVALAWSPRFERYGGPQVTRRLARAAGRPMNAHDWAAWMAGKALVAAAITAPRGSVSAFQKALADGELDGSKGVRLAFRPWDGQLRQPLLLTDGQTVIAQAPVEGVLHPRNVLDTLGADAPERLCRARP